MNEKAEKTELTTDEAIDKGIEMLSAMRGKLGGVVVMTHDEADGDAFVMLSRCTAMDMARVAKEMLGHPHAKAAFAAMVMAESLSAELSDDDRVEAVDGEEGK